VNYVNSKATITTIKCLTKFKFVFAVTHVVDIVVVVVVVAAVMHGIEGIYAV